MKCGDTGERQEDRWKDLEPGLLKYKTTVKESFGATTACDEAKPSVASNILSLIGVHGPVMAALLAAMKDVTGSACIENCETTFRYSKCIR